MHPPGGKCVHPEFISMFSRCSHLRGWPEFISSAHKLRYTLNVWQHGAHDGCTAFKIVHPVLESYTHGAGCTLSLKGNLAYNFMDLYFLCLSFHLEIYDMLKTTNIENTG